MLNAGIAVEHRVAANFQSHEAEAAI